MSNQTTVVYMNNEIERLKAEIKRLEGMIAEYQSELENAKLKRDYWRYGKYRSMIESVNGRIDRLVGDIHVDENCIAIFSR